MAISCSELLKKVVQVKQFSRNRYLIAAITTWLQS